MNLACVGHNIATFHIRGVTLRLAWADIKGPLLDKHIYGLQYFLIFVDEFTHVILWNFHLHIVATSVMCGITGLEITVITHPHMYHLITSCPFLFLFVPYFLLG